jgi:integrase/recombinase XerC
MQAVISKKFRHGILSSLSVIEKVTSRMTKKRARPRKAVPQTVRRDHYELLLAEIKDPYRTMMMLQYAVGLRPGEACRMRLADLSLDTGDLVTPRDGKTGERRLYFDPQGPAAVALRDWLDVRPPGPFLFGGSKAVRVNTYSVTVSRCCERLGIPHIKPYALRHTYACEMMDGGKPIASISEALGHTSVLTTARYYLHPNPDMMRKMNAGR